MTALYGQPFDRPSLADDGAQLNRALDSSLTRQWRINRLNPINDIALCPMRDSDRMGWCRRLWRKRHSGSQTVGDVPGPSAAKANVWQVWGRRSQNAVIDSGRGRRDITWRDDPIVKQDTNRSRRVVLAGRLWWQRRRLRGR